MRFLLRPTLLLVALAAWPSAGVAQPAETAWATWRQSMRRALAGVEAVRYVETSERTVEGPRRRGRRIWTETAVYAPRRGRPAQRLLRVELNGRPIPPPEYERMRERMRRAFGRAVDLGRSWTPISEVQRLARAQPIGPPQPTRVDGIPAWEIPLDGPSVGEPVDRATVWLSRHGGPRLLRSRIAMRYGPRGTATVVTDYDRRGGLDVPTRRTLEAEVRQRRRIRTFTTLIDVDAVYDDYEVVR